MEEIVARIDGTWKPPAEEAKPAAVEEDESDDDEDDDETEDEEDDQTEMMFLELLREKDFKPGQTTYEKVGEAAPGIR